MRGEIELVSTGSELLSGRTVNRHAQTLGRSLRALGLKLVRDTTVPDDIDRIEEAVSAALKRVDVVVVSGGLGPTCDDVTREAIARLLRRSVVRHEPSVEALRERFRQTGRALTEQSERQACIVEGAEALPNPVGAAPAQKLEFDGKTVFVLPGPPREFLAVLEAHVVPWLCANLGPVQAHAERTLMVCGIGESDIVALFEKDGFPPAGIEVAYSAAPGRIEVSLSSSQRDPQDVEAAAKRAKELLASNVFTEGRLTMEEVVGRLLIEKKATLATAESCTGGLVGHRITNVSGSSNYYLGGIVAYSNEAKTRDLGVDRDVVARHGAVSAEVAQQMAAGVRKRFGADYGLAITGIAGPTGGTAEKPVGLVCIALADRHEVRVKQSRFAGDRENIKEWSGQMALDFLRRRLQGVL